MLRWEHLDQRMFDFGGSFAWVVFFQDLLQVQNAHFSFNNATKYILQLPLPDYFVVFGEGSKILYFFIMKEGTG